MSDTDLLDSKPNTPIFPVDQSLGPFAEGNAPRNMSSGRHKCFSLWLTFSLVWKAVILDSVSFDEVRIPSCSSCPASAKRPRRHREAWSQHLRPSVRPTASAPPTAHSPPNKWPRGHLLTGHNKTLTCRVQAQAKVESLLPDGRGVDSDGVQRLEGLNLPPGQRRRGTHRWEGRGLRRRQHGFLLFRLWGLTEWQPKNNCSESESEKCPARQTEYFVARSLVMGVLVHALLADNTVGGPTNRHRVTHDNSSNFGGYLA